MKEFDPQPLPSLCPLCGGDNQCAVAAGEPAESCWCQRITIDASALQRIPAEERGRCCLCPACGKIKGDVVER